MTILFSGHPVVLGVIKIFGKGPARHATPHISVPPTYPFHGQDRQDERMGVEIQCPSQEWQELG